ncbi:ExbD/TolR family protein [Novipirellula artificiosorum]|uniref:Biopolymer transport protein ExbD n=1 Tax=Novipirellula artificiosorum TaxID=2528016 RepID=A0A5C6DHA5_9BACT|nr:biopolymer transporter ExbD [Novipirellula artificiosorum]TWU34426.1 Biopolymer transport protein ExbD [Novipirellula artificiosorum]
MAIRRERTEEATINLTPMIDVVFLLVIFFMVGSKFSEAESRINVNVPSIGEMRSMTRVPDERIVVVGNDGSLSLDDQAVTLEQLSETLRAQHANYPALRVAVRGDGASSFQQVAEVLHAVRSSGVEQVGLSARSNMRR